MPMDVYGAGEVGRSVYTAACCWEKLATRASGDPIRKLTILVVLVWFVREKGFWGQKEQSWWLGGAWCFVFECSRGELQAAGAARCERCCRLQAVWLVRRVAGNEMWMHRHVFSHTWAPFSF